MDKTQKGNYRTDIKGRYVFLRKREGICQACKRDIKDGEIKATSIHHLFYDKEDPTKYTIELCHRCHMHYHRLTGPLAEQHRKNIIDTCEKMWGKIPSNDYKFIKKTRSTVQGYKTGEKSFTKNEFEKLLSKIGQLDTEILILLAVKTSMRRDDIISLEIANINTKERTITFYERKKRRIRTIFIDSEMSRKLEIYLHTLPKSQKRLFAFSSKTAYNRLQALCELAGIPKRPFHALRATCIKFCQQAGWTPEEVSKLTGDTIRVIQEHYSTPSLTEMKETTEEKRIL